MLVICSCISKSNPDMFVPSLRARPCAYSLRARPCALSRRGDLRALRLIPQPVQPAQKSLHVARSFMSDVALYQRSYLDIFVLSSVKNAVLFYIPSLAIYRAMRYSNSQIVGFMMFNAIAKTTLEIWLATH